AGAAGLGGVLAPQTNRLAAQLAYDSGQASLGVWDLPGAADGFRHAVAVDPDFPDANFWLAQVLVWNGAPSEVWSPPASRALASPRGLAPRDGRLAEGLVAMADGRFPDACGAYRQVLRRDSLSFAAWFGLAECNAKDKVVVRERGRAAARAGDGHADRGRLGAGVSGGSRRPRGARRSARGAGRGGAVARGAALGAGDTAARACTRAGSGTGAAVGDRRDAPARE